MKLDGFVVNMKLRKNNMLELQFMIGPSGSGKSTYIEGYEGYEIVSPDDIRRELTGNVSNQKVNWKAWKLALERVIDHLNDEKSVILDGINVVSKSRGEFLKNVRKQVDAEFTTKAVVVGRGIDEIELFERVCADLDNDVDRSDVPLSVISRQIENFKNGEMNLANQFDEVIYYDNKF